MTRTLGGTTLAFGTPSDEWVVGQVYDSEKDLTEDVVAIDGIVYSLQVLARCIAPCRSPSYLPRGYAVRQCGMQTWEHDGLIRDCSQGAHSSDVCALPYPDGPHACCACASNPLR